MRLMPKVDIIHLQDVDTRKEYVFIPPFLLRIAWIIHNK